MSAALIATCVGGRRAGVTHQQAKNHAHRRHEAERAGMFKPDPGVGGSMWGLTRREVQALEAVIACGHAKVAAGLLGMSVKTLECHMQIAREKSGHRHIAPLVAAYVTAKLAGQTGEATP